MNYLYGFVCSQLLQAFMDLITSAHYYSSYHCGDVDLTEVAAQFMDKSNEALYRYNSKYVTASPCLGLNNI